MHVFWVQLWSLCISTWTVTLPSNRPETLPVNSSLDSLILIFMLGKYILLKWVFLLLLFQNNENILHKLQLRSNSWNMHFTPPPQEEPGAIQSNRQATVTILEGASVTTKCTSTSTGYPILFWCVQYPNKVLQFLQEEIMKNSKNFGARNLKDQNSPIVKHSVKLSTRLGTTVFWKTQCQGHRQSCAKTSRAQVRCAGRLELQIEEPCSLW